MRTTVLSAGVVGAEKQALALAAAVGFPHRVIRTSPTAETMKLPLRAQLAAQSLLGSESIGVHVPQPPYPTLAISCGRATVPASVALRAASGHRTLTVHVQRPLCSAAEFDLVIAPRHDYLQDSSVPANVLLTDGSLHSIDAAALEAAREAWEPRLAALPRPLLALLVGGVVSRRWWQRQLAPPLTAQATTTLLRSLAAAAAAAGGSFVATASRRTPAEVAAALVDGFRDAEASGLPAWLWRGEATPRVPNPYLGFLACADYLIVTADSVNMASEAAATGKPVYVLEPERCRGRFGTFHRTLRGRGLTRPWTGTLSPPDSWQGAPLNPMGECAARVERLVRERHGTMDVAYS